MKSREGVHEEQGKNYERVRELLRKERVIKSREREVRKREGRKRARTMYEAADTCVCSKGERSTYREVNIHLR
jgi:hypothetical protein